MAPYPWSYVHMNYFSPNHDSITSAVVVVVKTTKCIMQCNAGTHLGQRQKWFTVYFIHVPKKAGGDTNTSKQQASSISANLSACKHLNFQRPVTLV